MNWLRAQFVCFVVLSACYSVCFRFLTRWLWGLLSFIQKRVRLVMSSRELDQPLSLSCSESSAGWTPIKLEIEQMVTRRILVLELSLIEGGFNLFEETSLFRKPFARATISRSGV